MKNSLSEIYENILLNEAEKSNLQNPSADEVGNLKPKAEMFGSKPKAVEGPDKAKLAKGPAYKETTGSESKPKATNSSMPKSAPAKETKAEEPKEAKDTDTEPEEKEEKKEKKKSMHEGSFVPGAFEALFKKTLNEEEEDEEEEDEEELNEEEQLSLEEDPSEEAPETEEAAETEETEEEEEGDLLSDLRHLQDKLSEILSKLEDVEDESELEGDEEYSEEDFDSEFAEDSEGEEDEMSFKESIDKPKALNNSKGKKLMSKKNKVGRLSAKGGKANSGKIANAPQPKALGDKKTKLQKGKPEVKSSVKKGEFFK